MNLFLIIFLILFFHANFLEAENCLRFCVAHLSTGQYTFNNNLLGLNLQHCSHLILDAHSKNKEEFVLLKNALLYLQKSKSILPNLKILTSVRYGNLKLNETNNDKINRLFKLYERFDGFYFDWRDDFYNGFCREMEESFDRKECFSNILRNFRNKFNSNKIIVATIGPKNVYRDYYDLKVFNQNIDFIALGPDLDLQYLHMQNIFDAKQFISGNKNMMGDLANVLIRNGILKKKLLVFLFGPDTNVEPRIRVIWSSINNFPGILINHIEDFNNHLAYANKMNDDITKFEKLQICHSSSEDLSKKTTINHLTCYYSLIDENSSYLKVPKEAAYRNCDRIIFQKFSINSPTEVIKNIVTYFHNMSLTETSFILSIDLGEWIKEAPPTDEPEDNYNLIALNVKDLLIEIYNLDGIELICDGSINAKNLHNIITNIRTIVEKDIEIGLQINVFEAASESFVEVMNNVAWVTHKINPLSDVGLVIFYQWNNLYENYDLNLQKVIIKISPGIWQQNAIFSMDGKRDVNEKEDPEDDIILSRKYLCLNETIKQNLPSLNEFLNLPIIFSICEKDDEKFKEKLLKNMKNDRKLMFAILVFGKPLPRDLYHLRYETKEIIKYKIKVAEKYGFGGIAFDSITNDDVEEICGTSLFKELIKIIK